MSADPGPRNPFWAFSLATYGRPGVAEACLALQDRLGLDVNLLLFCLWAGRCGHRLSATELAALATAAGPWQQGVVVPLRGVRRRLKGAADPAQEALRQRIKRDELEAERLEQELLHRALPLAPGVDDPAAARANLLAFVGEEAPELEAMLNALD
ncbi:MAG: TIGR02444 family protein [Tistlia sp.]|uniref:TIGR02444 family protein n=1 Tax=Tistlia sp. TaxID=3057121 RepID=UPI0034A5990A